MKVNELNSAFDVLSPSVEQKSKMLEKIMKAKSAVPKKRVIPFAKYAGVAAAVFAIAIGIVFFADTAIDNDKGQLTLMDKEQMAQHGNMMPVPSTSEEIPAASKSAASSSAEAVGSDMSDAADKNEVGAASDKNKTAGTEEIREETKIDSAAVAVPEKVQDMEGGAMEDTASVVQENISSEAPETEDSTGKAAVPENEAQNEPIMSEVAPAAKTEAVSDIEADKEEIREVNGKVSGGGSSGGGGGSTAASKSISYEEIKNHGVYAELFPEYAADGFEFRGATQSRGNLKAVFSDAGGNSITVTISPNSSSKVIKPDEITAQRGDTVDFALKCDEYYVLYHSDINNSEEIYKMATSSPYFN